MFRIVPVGKKAVVEVTDPSTEGPARDGNKPTKCTCTYKWTCSECLKIWRPLGQDPAQKKADAAKTKKVNETTIADHEDVHLQSAHDALSARISNHKRDGKDASALEARLKKIAELIGKKA